MDLSPSGRAHPDARYETGDNARSTCRNDSGLNVTSTSSSTSELLGAVGGSSAVIHHHHHHHHHHLPRSSSPRPARPQPSPGPSPSQSLTPRRQSLGLPPPCTFPPRSSPRRVSQPRFPGLSPVRTQLQGLPTYEEAVAQGACTVPAGTPLVRTPRRQRVTPYRRVENTVEGVSPRRQSRSTVAVTVLGRTTLFEHPEVLSTPPRVRRESPPGISSVSSSPSSSPRTPDSLPDLVPISYSDEEISESPIARDFISSRLRVRRLLQLELLQIQTADRSRNSVWDEFVTRLIGSSVCESREQARAAFEFAFGRVPETTLGFVCDDVLRRDIYGGLVLMPEYRPE